MTTIASGALTGTGLPKDIRYSYTGRIAQWEKLVVGKEQDFVGKTVHCADGDWYGSAQGATTPGDDPGTGDEKDPNTGGENPGTGEENPPKPDDPENPHTHDWGEYTSADNADGHYQACTVCGEKSGIAAHDFKYEFDEDSHQVTCNVCDYFKTGAHEYDDDNDTECNTCGYRKAGGGDSGCEHLNSTMRYNASGHFQECTCGQTFDFAVHNYDGATYTDNKDGTHGRPCTAGCGYTEAEDHEYKYEKINDNNHEVTCKVCNYFVEIEHNYGEVTYQNDGHHQICADCKYDKVDDHTWSAYTSDSNGHDRTCTACGCVEHLDHVWSGYTSDGGTTHTRKCTATDEAHFETKDHEYKYEKFSDTQHKVTCKDNCGYLDNSNHTWGEYTDNKNGTHTKTCQQECCEPVTENHQYESGACACGSHKPELAGGTIDENGVLVSYDKKDEKNVVIPDGVTGIGDNAFQGCWALETVVIPDSVTSIGDAAFAGCHGLAEVSIPSTVETVGGGAFQYCSKLEHLEIGDGVKRIDHGAFEGCVALTAVTIPGSVESVGQGAFKGCTGLKEVTIENGVKEIGADAFQGCTNLTDVTIPGSVDTIGQGAFQGCVGLKTIVIPEGVTGLGECAFQGCTNLTDVKIPASMDTIGNGAFAATGITVMTIPEGVKHIGDGAFQGCGSLKSVEISASVESIGFHAFFECANFETITYAGTADQWLNLTKDVDLGIGNNVMVKCSDGTDLPGGRRAN